MQRPCWASVVLFLGSALASAGAPAPVQLAFLDGAAVSRADVIARLGAPYSTFDRDGVIAYRLQGDAIAGWIVLPPPKQPAKNRGWQHVAANLVLQFDAEGKLLRHALIPIHDPAGAAR